MENSEIGVFLHNIKKYNKIAMLEKFVEYLMEENKKVNLVSRKATLEDIWMKHIYDSILPAKFFDFSGKTVLDFGTGGGLPGIPLKILFPSMKLYLLDSIQKKINAADNICKKMELTDCHLINERLEEMQNNYKFDYVLSRSVRMSQKYIKIIKKILKSDGKILLYKSGNIEEDVLLFKHKIYDVSNDKIGTRKLVEIKKYG